MEGWKRAWDRTERGIGLEKYENSVGKREAIQESSDNAGEWKRGMSKWKKGMN